MKIIYGVFLAMLLLSAVFFAAGGEIFWAFGAACLFVVFATPLVQYYKEDAYGDHEKIINKLTSYQTRATDAYSRGTMTGDFGYYWHVVAEQNAFESSIETVPDVGTEWGGGQQYRYK